MESRSVIRHHVLKAEAVTLTSTVGGKARALAALRAADVAIPPWVVLVTDPADIGDLRSCGRRGQETRAERERCGGPLTISGSEFAELQSALTELCPNVELVAVRSSASDEDGPQHSFAGQLESFLFVKPADVAQKIEAVWRSGFSERVLAYRREHGLLRPPQAPAVLIQRMVRAEVSGVAFGVDPVSGRHGVAVVSAVYGLGTGLVSGDCDADTFRVDRDGRIIERQIAAKTIAHRFAPDQVDGVAPMPIPPEMARRPALDDAQVLAVADLVRRVGRHFGRPQDIEWAIENGKLYLLQARPITTLAATADPEGISCLWDNSNIAESYNGITTPLTFSFARYAYEEVYRQFCLVLRVPEDRVRANGEVFRNMLGLVRGRVYYNLLNWYRLLAMLPGFKANRRFMEQMMGVKESQPEAVVAELGATSWRERLRDRFRFFGSVFALVRHHFRIKRTIRRFYERLDQALGTRRPDLESRRPDELAAYYRDLERQLLTRWDAPLINDFLAMIFFGVLGKLCGKWCGDATGSLRNNLLCGEGGMISAEPAARVRELATLAAGDERLTAALCDGSEDGIRGEMDRVPPFRAGYEEYLEKFGDRCLEELKLESPTLFDQPLTLLRSIGEMARRMRGNSPPLSPPYEGGEKTVSPAYQGGARGGRRDAERQVRRTLRWRPLRRLLFGWVLHHVRNRVRDRENLRFERTRLFGRVRTIFVTLGRKFHALDLLAEPRDIFYLDVDEILGFVSGTATCADLKGLVSLRKQEFQRYRDLPPPAERFETRGMVYQGNTFAGTQPPKPSAIGDTRQGLGCCPGVVRGRVRVVRDPRNARLDPGSILVAERTDPGWIMLFPAAAGVLVERGSLLSHSAIVARELGIPAVVSLTGVTQWLHDGDLVELDGATGAVRKLMSPSERTERQGEACANVDSTC